MYDWIIAHIQWGTVGEWVGGIATGGAFAVTWRALLDEPRRVREDGELEQASKVFAFVEAELRQPPYAKKYNATNTGVFFEYVARIRNTSSLPILDVSIVPDLSPRIRPDVWSQSSEVLSSVMPDGIVGSPTEYMLTLVSVWSTFEEDWDRAVSLEFTDAGGRRWRRDRDQRLMKLRDP